MNSSLEPPRTVVFALCGSFCTFETALPQIIRLRACGWEVLPMLSYAASALDTRFGRAADWKQRLEEATGHRPLEDLREAEPLGPKHMAQALVIAPCTGTTMALLAAGISATPVTLAAKSMPVSYTHLDVYKRQAGNASARAAWRHWSLPAFWMAASRLWKPTWGMYGSAR